MTESINSAKASRRHGGAALGGLILIAVGAIFLLHTINAERDAPDRGPCASLPLTSSNYSRSRRLRGQCPLDRVGMALTTLFNVACGCSTTS